MLICLKINILFFIIIGVIIEENKRKCFNCRVTQTKHWYRYLQKHYLCQPCHDYKIYNDKLRPEGSSYQTNMV
uniref:GATA-type domain-containing protein n=1 Tax=Meloidogyne enterolobii TaxID=390850 RepID=A0A6V7XRF9_MELEN|nr:unnamed protein product [Meloidogyne enterolobii]